MNRRLFTITSALLAVAAFVLGSIGTSSVASAQVDTCCVRIIDSTDCHVTVCARSANGPLHCDLVYGHTNGGFRFRCDEADTHLEVADDACGLDHRLRVNECVRVTLRGGCCAKACLRVDPDGCFVVVVTPLPGPCPCPPQ